MEAFVHKPLCPVLGLVRLNPDLSPCSAESGEFTVSQEAINQDVSHKSTITGPHTFFQIPSAQQMH